MLGYRSRRNSATRDDNLRTRPDRRRAELRGVHLLRVASPPYPPDHQRPRDDRCPGACCSWYSGCRGAPVTSSCSPCSMTRMHMTEHRRNRTIAVSAVAGTLAVVFLPRVSVCSDDMDFFWSGVRCDGPFEGRGTGSRSDHPGLSPVPFFHPHQGRLLQLYCPLELKSSYATLRPVGEFLRSLTICLQAAGSSYTMSTPIPIHYP